MKTVRCHAEIDLKFERIRCFLQNLSALLLVVDWMSLIYIVRQLIWKPRNSTSWVGFKRDFFVFTINPRASRICRSEVPLLLAGPCWCAWTTHRSSSLALLRKGLLPCTLLLVCSRVAYQSAVEWHTSLQWSGIPVCSRVAYRSAVEWHTQVKVTSTLHYTCYVRSRFHIFIDYITLQKAPFPYQHVID